MWELHGLQNYIERNAKGRQWVVFLHGENVVGEDCCNEYVEK